MATQRIRFPDPPRSNDPQDWRNWANDLVRSLEAMELDRTTPASKSDYTTSNVTIDRTLDANNDTLAQVADVLGTLLEDLKSSGVI